MPVDKIGSYIGFFHTDWAYQVLDSLTHDASLGKAKRRRNAKEKRRQYYSSAEQFKVLFETLASYQTEYPQLAQKQQRQWWKERGFGKKKDFEKWLQFVERVETYKKIQEPKVLEGIPQ